MVFVDKRHPTGAALIIVDEATAQNQIVVIGGACEKFCDEDMPKILSQLERSDILLMQLETNMEPIKTLLGQAKRLGVTTVLNPAPAQPLEKEYLACVDIITPNETETQYFTGIQVTDEASAKTAAQRLMDNGIKKVVITMGNLGCYASDGKWGKMFDALDFGPLVDNTGAGDAFTGGLVAALAKGADFFDAVRYGNAAAGIAVTRNGTAPAMPFREEIERALQY